jgi:ADP-heptose:LPS heptosyltransferase
MSAGYIEVIDRLATVADCVLIGGEAEKGRLEEISAGTEGKTKVLAGVLSISELAVLIARANLLISVDTGPLHLAGAVGTPVLGLFGRSDYRIWGPRGPRDVVLHHKLDCWPCYQRECDHHRCMTSLEPQEVMEAALKILSNAQD